jgi:hypothetical protein
MEVLSLTVFVSLGLAGVFIAVFIHTARRPHAECVERESLLPLSEDRTSASPTRPAPSPHE